MKRVYLVSLGCPKNLVDSEVILGLLEREGIVPAASPSAADFIIVNTCAFIREAVEESIETILTLAQGKKKNQILAVAGCLPQRYQGELREALPEVDRWVDLHSLEHLPDILKGLKPRPSPHTFLLNHTHPRHRLTPPSWAYVKIGEGCNNRCSYCTIPSIKGPLRSRPIGDITEEAKRLAEDGVVEINLIAQDITRYGEDLGYRHGLLDLIDALENIEGIQWIRLLYAHPAGVTKELAQRLGKGKVLPYLEMPIQHVAERVLKAMGRRGGKKAVINALEHLAGVKEIFLRATVIVGFPTEGEREFEELLSFVENAPFFRLAVFPYSPEEGTPAATLDQLPEEVIQERYNCILSLQGELHLAKNSGLIGREFPLLMEDRNWGRFPGQAPEIDGRVKVKEETTSTITKVLITETDGIDLYAKLL